MAVTKLAPGRAAEVLTQAVVLMAEPPHSFATEYARRFPQDARIWTWLQSHEQDHYGLLTRGTVAGLGQSGPDGLKVLQRFVDDAAFEKANGWVLRAVIDAARRRGIRLSCEGDLSYVCHKVDPETCAEQTKRADAARRRCLASMRRWLAAELR